APRAPCFETMLRHLPGYTIRTANMEKMPSPTARPARRSFVSGNVSAALAAAVVSAGSCSNDVGSGIGPVGATTGNSTPGGSAIVDPGASNSGAVTPGAVTPGAVTPGAVTPSGTATPGGTVTPGASNTGVPN